MDDKRKQCCDGTGWTGDPRQPCVEHYEPLDDIWRGHVKEEGW